MYLRVPKSFLTEFFLASVHWMGIPGKNGLCPEWHGCSDQCVGVWGVVLPSCWAPWFGESESEVSQSCPTLCDPVDYQALPSMRFSRQEYWSGLPFPSPGSLPNTGITPVSPVAPALPADSLPLSHWGSLSFWWSGKSLSMYEIKLKGEYFLIEGYICTCGQNFRVSVKAQLLTNWIT